MQREIAASKNNQEAVSQTSSNVYLDNKTKQCPACGNSIKYEAIKCKYCGAMVDEIPKRECPFCKELIAADATKCLHCKSDLNL
jgi:predicted amidophosphoribosyltransferase